MPPVPFGIIGAGWRADFYLRAARELPERFALAGAVVRDAGKGAAFEARWGARSFRTLDDLLSGAAPAFVVVCVKWAPTPEFLRALSERGVPALSETPPAPDTPGLLALCDLLERGARIQVAEQYPFQPIHAARLAVARSGLLGAVTEAQVSAAHAYHGMALIRSYLGVRFEEAVVTAKAFASPIVASPRRGQAMEQETISESRQLLAWVDYGGRLGVFDFAGEQYHSPIRSNRILLRGERGEIHDETVRLLEDFRTPVRFDLVREDAGQGGNLDGLFHKGYLARGTWVYQNPYPGARLADDEVAVATCLDRMAAYAAGGPPFYGLAEAAQDHYVGILIQKAAKAGTPIPATRQPWAAG